MNMKSIISMIVTTVIVLVSAYTFSGNIGLDFLDKPDIKFDDILTDSRRNIPIEASFSLNDYIDLDFDLNGKNHTIKFEFIPTEDIKVNNQVIKAPSDGAVIELSNFNGKVMISNGSSEISGNVGSILLSGYEFTGRNSIHVNGEIIGISISNVGGNFKFSDIEGNFDVITNQSVQVFSIQNKDIELRNYLGSFSLTDEGFGLVDIKGNVAKLVTPDFTISKDY